VRRDTADAMVTVVVAMATEEVKDAAGHGRVSRWSEKRHDLIYRRGAMGRRLRGRTYAE